MKDYYKILGVKENASEEEIRAQWIELTKHYHPDRGERLVSDERIKEINEAYQVLKHSSTRVEYDLKRAYGQKKRGFNLQKLALPVSILIIFIIMGTIYFREPQEPSVSTPIISSQMTQINPTNPINSTNPLNSTNPINPKNQRDQRKLSREMQNLFHRDQLTQVATVPPVAPVVNPINSPNPTNPTNPITPSVAMAATMEKVQLPQQFPPPITQLPNELITNRLNDPIDSPDLTLQLAQFKPPSLLTTEDEVRKFFNHYVERYHRMDIEGFLSLFSLKAIQNQKDGLEEIRKIYTNFFNQGKDVHYTMQDLKIEIYQNAVDVKARYEIEQILKMGGEKKVWRGFVRWVLGKENGVLKILSLDYQHQKGGGQ